MSGKTCRSLWINAPRRNRPSPAPVSSGETVDALRPLAQSGGRNIAQAFGLSRRWRGEPGGKGDQFGFRRGGRAQMLGIGAVAVEVDAVFSQASNIAQFGQGRAGGEVPATILFRLGAPP